MWRTYIFHFTRRQCHFGRMPWDYFLLQAVLTAKNLKNRYGPRLEDGHLQCRPGAESRIICQRRSTSTKDAMISGGSNDNFNISNLKDIEHTQIKKRERMQI